MLGQHRMFSCHFKLLLKKKVHSSLTSAGSWLWLKNRASSGKLLFKEPVQSWTHYLIKTEHYSSSLFSFLLDIEWVDTKPHTKKTEKSTNMPHKKVVVVWKRRPTCPVKCYVWIQHDTAQVAVNIWRLLISIYTNTACGAYTETYCLDILCPAHLSDRLTGVHLSLHVLSWCCMISIMFLPFFCFLTSRSNVLPTTNSTYLKTCRYDKEHHPYCPIFLVGDVITQTGYNFQDLATKASGLNDLTWS